MPSNPCPTCSGPIRRTVGMVCPDCGADYAPDLDVEAIRARLDAALAHIRECMHIGLQDAKLYDEAGRKRIGEWADFIDKQIHAALAAPEMPRPPAVEAQERPEGTGTGSGRGTGVTGAPGLSHTIEFDDTDAWVEIEHPLLGDNIETEYLGETNGIHRWRLTNPAAGASSITFPSLPVPSTEEL